ncbi:M48 family metallopeptidase [bacterium]|nr:M48 family metallopeptidase [bacterium]
MNHLENSPNRIIYTRHTFLPEIITEDQNNRQKISETDFRKYSLYLDDLARNIERISPKRIQFTVTLIESEFANAYANQGNNILITTALLKMLNSESELVAVLAHEMGHVELEHTSKTVNKSNEEAADDYAFTLLMHTPYDPRAASRVLRNLKKIYDIPLFSAPYFDSHPPIALRIDRFSSKAALWWKNNPDSMRYIGKRNFFECKNFFIEQYSDEWEYYKIR